MDQKEIREAMAALKQEIQEAIRTVSTEAEYREKVDKLAQRVDQVMEDIKEATKKRFGSYDPDIPAGKGVKALVDRGLQQVKDFRKISALEVPEEGKNLVRLHDEVYLLHAMAMANLPSYREDFRRRGLAAFSERFPGWGTRWTEFLEGLKATSLISTTGGSGDEWVPTGMSATLFDEVRVITPEAALIPSSPMPTNPWDWPKKTGVGQCYIRSEGVAPTASVLSTGKVTFTAYTFANFQQFSDEMSEDSIIAVLPAVRADILRSLAEGLSMAIVNGDSDGASHFDSDYQTASLGSGYPQNSAFSGLRQYCLDAHTFTVDGGGNAISYADIGSAIAAMGKYGATRTSDLVVLVDSAEWVTLLTESGSPIVTVDKYGPRATILTGELGKIYGARVFTSHGLEERVGDRTDAVGTSGKHTGTADTYGLALVFNVTRWRIGDRRDVRFETDKVITSGLNQMVATARWALQPMESGSNVKHTVAIVNVS